VCWLLSALAAPLAASMVSSTGWAGNPPPADLLEFLGSVDSEDGSWSEYLGSTDPGQVAKPDAPKIPARTAAPAGVPAAKPPATAPAPAPRPPPPAAKAGP
jgi:hypothetical protein